MNKITTKFRTLGRLSVWVSISFGIAIATSQTANAWQAINNIDNNVYFLTCSSIFPTSYNGSLCYNTDYFTGYEDYDGEMALGHTLSCGQDQKKCGAGHGQDLFVAVPLVGAVRLLYPAVHVPPHGVVIFSPRFYTTSDDELFPSIVQIPTGQSFCQKWSWEKCIYPYNDYNHCWVNADDTLCDQAPDRHRVP